MTNPEEIFLRPLGKPAASHIVRPQWYRRLWNWFTGRKPGTLFATHIFDQGVTCCNGEELKITYTVTMSEPVGEWFDHEEKITLTGCDLIPKIAGEDES